jgi:hypothetical protein
LSGFWSVWGVKFKFLKKGSLRDIIPKIYLWRCAKSKFITKWKGELLNTVGHIFFANLLLVFGAPSMVSPTALLIASIASIITDLEHISHLRVALKTRRFKSETRTRWHELPGLLLGMSISLTTMLFSVTLGRLLLIGFVSHYFLDLLTRPTRPFYPMSKKVVFLSLAPRNLKKLTAYDTVITVIMGLILIAGLYSQSFLNM